LRNRVSIPGVQSPRDGAFEPGLAITGKKVAKRRVNFQFVLAVAVCGIRFSPAYAVFTKELPANAQQTNGDDLRGSQLTMIG
jgi:hypothetical protein